MALKTVDLTQQPDRAVFTGGSQEEVNYASSFWQSIQLLPPMESRLVSSDIKQRLRKAPPSRSLSEWPLTFDQPLLFDQTNLLDMLYQTQADTIENNSCQAGDEFGNTFLVDIDDIRKQLLGGIKVQKCSGDPKKEKKKEVGTAHILKAPPIPEPPPGHYIDPYSMLLYPEAEPDKVKRRRKRCQGKCVVTWGERPRLHKEEIFQYDKFLEAGGEAMRRLQTADEQSSLPESMLADADRDTTEESQEMFDIGPSEAEIELKSKLIVIEKAGQPQPKKPPKQKPSKVICWVDKPMPTPYQTGMGWPQSSFNLKFSNTIKDAPLDTTKMPGYMAPNYNVSTSPDSHGITPEGAVFPCSLISTHTKTMTCTMYPNPLPPPPVYLGWAKRVDTLKTRGSRDRSKDQIFKFPYEYFRYWFGPECPKREQIEKSRKHAVLWASYKKSPLDFFVPLAREGKFLSGDGKFQVVYTRPVTMDILPGTYTSRQTESAASNLRDFFVRAKTMEHIEEFRRLQQLSSAREEDRELLHKHRAERIKKEEISKRVERESAVSRNITSVSGLSVISRDNDELMEELLEADVREEIDRFEKLKGVTDNDADSD